MRQPHNVMMHQVFPVISGVWHELCLREGLPVGTRITIGGADMLRKGSHKRSLEPKIVDYVHHHAYTGDGWEVECAARHDIPAAVRRRGVRVAMAWAVDHCPRIRAAIDADRRRN